ncbi:MAG: metalloregulator ArsR/SmtB family transcription factor [Acidobacteriota bacterium]|nr:metalloregulator ArsR/SmtB family transcription factor [Acidobacteriota bacterium]
MREFLSVTKALGDESRVRALMSVKSGELCLCQIVEVLGLSPATVSRHMNILHQAGLVERRKDGKWHFYRLASGSESPLVRNALAWTLEELSRDPSVRADARRIREIRRQDLEELSACYRS